MLVLPPGLSSSNRAIEMEMHQIRYFLTVCQTLNFTRAAEECNVSQPALSRAVKQLEDELGADLFRRERTLTHITDFGRAVLPALRQCYDGSLTAKALAHGYLKAGHAPLHLALSRSIEMELLSPLLSEITTAFPRMEIKLVRGPPHEIGEKLKAGEAEVAVAGPLGDGWDRFETRKLYKEQFGLLLNRRHPLAVEDSVDVQRLSKERLLSRPHCSLTEALLQKLNHLGGGKISVHEIALLDDLPELVRGNFGVGIWPTGRRVADDLVIKEVRGTDLSRWIHVYSVAGRKYSVAAATLIKLLRVKDWTMSARAMTRERVQ
jgi:DNA-binding transcriptional LysR family regulator